MGKLQHVEQVSMQWESLVRRWCCSKYERERGSSNVLTWDLCICSLLLVLAVCTWHIVPTLAECLIIGFSPRQLQLSIWLYLVHHRAGAYHHWNESNVREEGEAREKGKESEQKWGRERKWGVKRTSEKNRLARRWIDNIVSRQGKTASEWKEQMSADWRRQHFAICWKHR